MLHVCLCLVCVSLFHVSIPCMCVSLFHVSIPCLCLCSMHVSYMCVSLFHVRECLYSMYRLYRDIKQRPRSNLLFVLSGGGKLNYFGTKNLLDEANDELGIRAHTHTHTHETLSYKLLYNI